MSTAFEKGIIDQATAMQELKQSSDATGVFSNITDEQIEEAKMAPPPMPVEGEPVVTEEQQPASLMDRIKAWINQ